MDEAVQPLALIVVDEALKRVNHTLDQLETCLRVLGATPEAAPVREAAETDKPADRLPSGDDLWRAELVRTGRHLRPLPPASIFNEAVEAVN